MTGGGFEDSAEEDERIMRKLTQSAAPNGLKGLLDQRDIMDRSLDGWRSYKYSLKSQAIKGAKTLPKKLGRKVRRLGIGAAGALPLGMLAIGAGAATGDPAKAAALAMAAGSAGYNFTNYYGDKVAKANRNSNEFSKNFYMGSTIKST